MKTTIEIPDILFRRAKATAAARGESLKELVSTALRVHLTPPAENRSEPAGWRAVFGRARARDTARVDAVIAAELEQFDPADWR